MAQGGGPGAAAAPQAEAWTNEKKLTVSGVGEVVSFEENAVVLRTSRGTLLVRGQDLHLKTLSLDGGQVAVDGTVTALIYEDPGEADFFPASLADGPGCGRAGPLVSLGHGTGGPGWPWSTTACGSCGGCFPRPPSRQTWHFWRSPSSSWHTWGWPCAMAACSSFSCWGWLLGLAHMERLFLHGSGGSSAASGRP